MERQIVYACDEAGLRVATWVTPTGVSIRYVLDENEDTVTPAFVAAVEAMIDADAPEPAAGHLRVVRSDVY